MDTGEEDILRTLGVAGYTVADTIECSDGRRCVVVAPAEPHTSLTDFYAHFRSQFSSAPQLREYFNWTPQRHHGVVECPWVQLRVGTRTVRVVGVPNAQLAPRLKEQLQSQHALGGSAGLLPECAVQEVYA